MSSSSYLTMEESYLHSKLLSIANRYTSYSFGGSLPPLGEDVEMFKQLTPELYEKNCKYFEYPILHELMSQWTYSRLFVKSLVDLPNLKPLWNGDAFRSRGSGRTAVESFIGNESYALFSKVCGKPEFSRLTIEQCREDLLWIVEKLNVIPVNFSDHGAVELRPITTPFDPLNLILDELKLSLEFKTSPSNKVILMIDVLFCFLPPESKPTSILQLLATHWEVWPTLIKSLCEHYDWVKLAFQPLMKDRLDDNNFQTPWDLMNESVLRFCCFRSKFNNQILIPKEDSLSKTDIENVKWVFETFGIYVNHILRTDFDQFLNDSAPLMALEEKFRDWRADLKQMLSLVQLNQNIVKSVSTQISTMQSFKITSSNNTTDDSILKLKDGFDNYMKETLHIGVWQRTLVEQIALMQSLKAQLDSAI
jgi:hypothetical protein